MIELFTSDTPNGKKISIMLEEIGYEYKVTKIDLSKDEQFSTLNVPSLDVSQFDELTTAHNGFLTMAVEYGAAMSLFFLIVIK